VVRGRPSVRMNVRRFQGIGMITVRDGTSATVGGQELPAELRLALTLSYSRQNTLPSIFDVEWVELAVSGCDLSLALNRRDLPRRQDPLQRPFAAV